MVHFIVHRSRHGMEDDTQCHTPKLPLIQGHVRQFHIPRILRRTLQRQDGRHFVGILGVILSVCVQSRCIFQCLTLSTMFWYLTLVFRYRWLTIMFPACKILHQLAPCLTFQVLSSHPNINCQTSSFKVLLLGHMQVHARSRENFAQTLSSSGWPKKCSIIVHKDVTNYKFSFWLLLCLAITPEAYNTCRGPIFLTFVSLKLSDNVETKSMLTSLLKPSTQHGHEICKIRGCIGSFRPCCIA